MILNWLKLNARIFITILFFILAKSILCQDKVFLNDSYYITSNNHIGGTFYISFKDTSCLHALSLTSKSKHKLEFDDYVASLKDNKLKSINHIVLRIDNKDIDEFTFVNNVTFSNGQYVFYHLDKELHYFISKDEATSAYNQQVTKKLVDYQTSQLQSVSGGFYSIKNYYETIIDNRHSRPNLEIKEFINDSIIWQYQIDYVMGDEYSPLIKSSIDVNNQDIAILSLSNPEFYILNKSSLVIDTIEYLFKDSLGNIQLNYIKPSVNDVITCNRKLEGYQDIVNNRFRNEKLFFLSDSLIMVSYIVPAYKKLFRNILLMKCYGKNDWRIHKEYFKVDPRNKDIEKTCRDQLSLLLASSINPVFYNNTAYYMNLFTNQKEDCMERQVAIKHYLRNNFNQTLISKYKIRIN
jgi:hypothetical protein